MCSFLTQRANRRHVCTLIQRSKSNNPSDYANLLQAISAIYIMVPSTTKRLHYTTTNIKACLRQIQWISNYTQNKHICNLYGNKHLHQLTTLLLRHNNAHNNNKSQTKYKRVSKATYSKRHTVWKAFDSTEAQIMMHHQHYCIQLDCICTDFDCII